MNRGKNEEEFNKFVKKVKGKTKSGQYEFYSRTLDFMKSDKKFIINPAGMGLGKTIATTDLIKSFLDCYHLTFIANPTSPLKYVWVKDINEVGLLPNTAIWPSKRDVCIKKQLFKDRTFALSKCNDDCEYQLNCKHGREYSNECREDYERYMNMGEKAIPLTYYDELIKKNKINIVNYLKNKERFPFNCLYAPTRMGLRDLYIPYTRKIIIGDYYGFLIPNMFEMVTNINPKLVKSLLIIDEGHLINIRARDFFSQKVYLKRELNRLEIEFDKYKIPLTPKDQENIIVFIENLKKLIKVLEERYVDKAEYKYEYAQLKKDFINNQLVLEDIIDSLNLLDKVINKNRDDEEQSSASLKFKRYFSSLINNSCNRQYYCFVKLTKYYSKEEIVLNCNCLTPSEDLKKLFKNWEKVIINTGTLSDNKRIVLSEIGIDKEDCIYEDLIKSYDLSDYVFIHNEGKFNSSNRNNTYKENDKNLTKILNKMSNKTMIFIQSKENSLLLENLLSKNFKVINFCKDQNSEEEITPEKFEKLKEEFVNYKGKCIGIINILGRVEGHNFTDDDSIPQVSNVIIYGFPLPIPQKFLQAREQLYIKEFPNEQSILNHIYLTEPIQKIQQACYRCKRSDEQKPIIIIWGSRFSKNENIYLYQIDKTPGKYRAIKEGNNIFNSLPSDFKKHLGNYNELIKFIEKKEDDRGK